MVASLIRRIRNACQETCACKANGQLVIGYQRPIGAISSNYVLQFSSNLLVWLPVDIITISEMTTVINATTEQVTLRLNLSAVGAQFFRIEE